MHPKVVDVGHLKLALGWFEEEVVGFKHFQYFMYNLAMSFEVVFHGDEDVICVVENVIWVFQKNGP